MTHQDATFEAEWEPHAQTFMSWPNREIWDVDVRYVRKDIARLAKTISDFEPVVMLAGPDQVDEAQRRCGSAVQVLPLEVNDLWARDTVPVFVRDNSTGQLQGVDFGFNGWGRKQQHDHDAFVAQKLISALGIQRSQASIIGEGGSLETDGQGTLMVTKSSLLNSNRNPGLTLEELDSRLKETLGVTTVIWFDGVYGEDITDAHVDSLARFAAPGVVLLDVPGLGAPYDVWAASSAQAKGLLHASADARGQSFEIIELPQPDYRRVRGSEEDFLASYTNFYIANGAVFVPEFGDRKADKNARSILQEHFSDRKIVPLGIDVIASGGGGIHCATRELPRLAANS
ncbi:agmatine deiminase family protein [Acaricomes phytoseiuli]|uniref:agmatine deiminase family protein n=1 Tax=Acaricomes phytoseiuli TaxID=291968 RepID=UPI00037E0B2D|nr:agmatine deiminase family protein [Acaricomes phytoseiuli]MCW1250581.1 agmatine deiminase family protein [Acaricomes phytoseiuli]